MTKVGHPLDKCDWILLGLEIVDEADATVDMRELAQKKWKKRAKIMGLDL